MPDLMLPRERQELISALACGTHKRQTCVVDAERVLLERACSLLIAVDLAAQLAPARDRLDRVGAALGQVSEPEAATAPNHATSPTRLSRSSTSRVQRCDACGVCRKWIW